MIKVVYTKSIPSILLNVALLSLIGSCSLLTKRQDPSSPTQETISEPSLTKSSVNHFIKDRENYLIDHGFFQISYVPDQRMAKYVSYELKAKDLKKKSFKRKDRFQEDPILAAMNLPTVKPSEYLKTGYDRGHLAPSADFAWSEKANDLTFMMSNMVPQKPNLNRNSWKRLEEKVRKWACGEEHISVITGPILKENLPRLKSGLIIPEEFFKVIVDQTPPRKIIAFIYHQNDKGDVLNQKVVPLAKIENATKISFTNFYKSFTPNEKRSPASLDVWKEAKCN